VLGLATERPAEDEVGEIYSIILCCWQRWCNHHHQQPQQHITKTGIIQKFLPINEVLDMHDETCTSEYKSSFQYLATRMTHQSSILQESWTILKE
jgi:hypothetical protein